MTTFIDTNIVIALLDDSDPHHIWSVEKFNECKSKGPVIINDIVYCEVSVGMESTKDLDEALEQVGLERMPSADQALFDAGKAFMQYKKGNKGPKLGVMPDFIIGASANLENKPLLTTNPKDFSGYFPDIKIICP